MVVSPLNLEGYLLIEVYTLYLCERKNVVVEVYDTPFTRRTHLLSEQSLIRGRENRTPDHLPPTRPGDHHRDGVDGRGIIG